MEVTEKMKLFVNWIDYYRDDFDSFSRRLSLRWKGERLFLYVKPKLLLFLSKRLVVPASICDMRCIIISPPFIS